MEEGDFWPLNVRKRDQVKRERGGREVLGEQRMKWEDISETNLGNLLRHPQAEREALWIEHLRNELAIRQEVSAL
jgi:hypothetical protein